MLSQIIFSRRVQTIIRLRGFNIQCALESSLFEKTKDSLFHPVKVMGSMSAEVSLSNFYDSKSMMKMKVWENLTMGFVVLMEH